MKPGYPLLLASLIALGCIPAKKAAASPFRPPAVPLVTSDPYLSIWSEADHLTDDVTRHWTHAPNALVSLLRCDGRCYRLMGNDPESVPALPQTGLQVTPTRTIYHFANSRIAVTLTFTTAALPSNLTLFSRPLSYIAWQVHSRDGMKHNVSIYFSASSELCVNTTDQAVVWKRMRMGQLEAERVGTQQQPMFSPMGDGVRIDWGYAYVAVKHALAATAIASNKTALQQFVQHGTLPATAHDMPRAVQNGQPVLCCLFSHIAAGKNPVSRHLIVAYDELYNIDFFGEPLRPYWRRNHTSCAQMLEAAEREYPAVSAQCEEFDRHLTADLTRAGGPEYAQIAALAYRQCAAACGLSADKNGKPLFFTKENTSNGDVATVDVIFPMDPVWILLSPTLAKASLAADLQYAASSHWKFPNAPHDIGTYPVVMGRDDGGEGMPVEESGNILILCDAICQDDGNARFVTPWWSKLTQWAVYLKKYGLDPENQLCTDDFMGHLAHNANLSVKAILGLAAYADMCRMRGDLHEARVFHRLALTDARHWQKVADAGSHSLLAFDKPGTWSQKYNLVWNRILHLNVFPPSVAAKEIAFYKTKMLPYGVPLDSRTHLTKSDWSTWAAALSTSKQDFETLFHPVYEYMDHTTARDPVADSYLTDNIHSSGMHARPVVGGLFIQMLNYPSLWKKWEKAGNIPVSGWAALPPPPIVHTVVPCGKDGVVNWRYTTQAPSDGWQSAGFDDSGWQTGQAGFGTAGTPAIAVHTTWNTDDIWIRRTFVMPAGHYHHLALEIFHDEDVQVYFNGVLAQSQAGFITDYQPFPIYKAALPQLKPGVKITVAVHCHQTTGGQGIDVGLVDVVRP